MAAIFAHEIDECLRYLEDPDFYQPEVEDPDVENGKVWLGAADDAIMRKRGVEFVDGSAPGFAAIVGAAPDSATAKADCSSLKASAQLLPYSWKTNS